MLPASRRLTLLALAAAVLAASSVPALAEPAGQIYTVGAEARPTGMGGAYTAVAQDASALYYNPGGLGMMQHREVSLLQASLYGGADFQYMNYGQNFSKTAGGWAVEMIRLSVGGIQGRDQFNNETGGISYAETSLGLGMGWRGIGVPELSLGWKLKELKRQLGPSSDSFMAADLGAQYGPFFHDRMTLGAVMQNAVSERKGDTADSLPSTLRVGAAYRVFGPMMLALDVGSDHSYSFGTEYTLGLASLRAGMQANGFTFGAGLLFRQSFSFDVAMVQNSTLGMSQRVSLGYKFGARRKGPAKNLEFAAKEHFDNAMAELDKRHYIDASSSLDQAIALDPSLGDNGWKYKAKRLHSLIKALDLIDHPEFTASFAQPTDQANQGYHAVMAYLDRDEELAMLLAHASSGTDRKDPAFAALLEGLADLTHRPIVQEEILPTDQLVERKLLLLARYLYQRDFDNAIRAGKQAVMLNPKHALAWTRLGSAYFASGDKLEAAEAYRKALDLQPNNDQLRKFMKMQGME